MQPWFLYNHGYYYYNFLKIVVKIQENGQPTFPPTYYDRINYQHYLKQPRQDKPDKPNYDVKNYRPLLL